MEAVTMSTMIEFVMMTEKTLLMGSKTQNSRPTFIVAAKVPPVWYKLYFLLLFPWLMIKN